MTRDQLILALYRMSRTLDYTEFQSAALDLVAQRLPFDQALWAALSNTGSTAVVHSLHYHGPEGHPPPECPKEWFQRAMNRPGRTLWLSPQGDDPAAHVLCTALPERTPPLFRSVSLFRAGYRYPYSEPEQRFKEWLMPHLIESFDFCRLLQLRSEGLNGSEAGPGLASADPSGILNDVDPRFAELLQAEWPDWHGARLPEPLQACTTTRTETHFRGRHILVHSKPAGRLALLAASELGRQECLSERERVIAGQFAAGRSYKAISDDLAIAPATVRNHLAAVYRKLKVRNKVELARILERT